MTNPYILVPKPQPTQRDIHTISFRTHKNMIDQLNTLCSRTGYTKSEIIRRFIQQGLDENHELLQPKDI